MAAFMASEDKGVENAGEKNVAIEFAPRSRTGEKCRCGRGNQNQSFDDIQQIPTRAVHRDIGDDVFVGKNEEGIHHDPPHQQNEDIQRARQHPLALIGLMGADGHAAMMGTTCRNNTISPAIGVGQRLANHYFKPRPACLVEAPHGHARRHQTPKQAGMSTAVEGVSGGDDARSRDHQQRRQISHGHAKVGVGKHCRRQRKSHQQTNSPEERRDVEQRHHVASYDVRHEMFRSRTGYRGYYGNLRS